MTRWLLCLLALAGAAFGACAAPGYCDGPTCACFDEPSCAVDCEVEGCAIECASTDECLASCLDGCSYACHDTPRCEIDCGADCTIDCRQHSSCAARCGPRCDG